MSLLLRSPDIRKNLTCHKKLCGHSFEVGKWMLKQMALNIMSLERFSATARLKGKKSD